MKSNAEYHANRTHLNSSALKTLLRSPEQFHREWVLGMREQRTSAALEEGTLTHSLILEPDAVAGQYAFYEGLRRAGTRYEEFAAANAGKTLMTQAQKAKADKLHDAWKARVEAVSLLSGGLAEHNIISDYMGVPLKCRCDYINVEQGYIADVKTTAYPADVDFFRNAIQEYSYDLSAAMYALIAEQAYGQPFDFYFVVISKSDVVCDIYRASPATIADGKAKLIQALTLYKKCTESGIWLANQPAKRYDSINYEIEEV